VRVNAASALGVGWVIEGFAGQTIRTAAGIESGWTSSTVSVSPERVSCPLARTMGDDVDTAGFRPVEVPGSAATRTGTDLFGLFRAVFVTPLLHICCTSGDLIMGNLL
jgi:hypothetical protein